MTVHDDLTRCGGQLAPETGVIGGLPTAARLGLTVKEGGREGRATGCPSAVGYERSASSLRAA